ncbi:MAG: F0F1 ATP synthase subunit epsilon [Mycoplasmataceae bacterium]|jgi:F-type H+-transporting ATPase subunit epsilon|nr:F0F1 ATP synthase subunit epsilon [Mycoplasmataceae bacterium]
MPKPFKLKINTPDGTSYEDEILQIELKTPNGVVGFLADHQPSIGAIMPSICYIKDQNGNRVPAVINSGIYKMDGNQINVITDFFDFTDKINQSVFEIRRRKIENAINKQDIKNIKTYKDIQRKLENEINQLSKLSKK